MQDKSKRKRQFVIMLILITVFIAEGCSKGAEPPPRDFAMVDLLITQDDIPAGWQIEFPAGHFQGFYYPQEAVAIVFVPDTGVRRATGQDIYRFLNTEEAVFRLHNNYIPEVLNSGEFVPAEWIHPTLSVDEDKFVCVWATVGRDPQKFMQCEWTARYDEFIVSFVSWVLPDLMNLEQMKTIITKIDGKMSEQLGK